jgi:hypothetical protein
MSNARNLANFKPSASGQVETADIADAAVTSVKLAAGAAIPSQTGNAGKFLTTNGTDASWGLVSGFDSGTVMLFAQTSAPTGWTKDTTNYNNSGLRVVTGSASTGGSVDFTTAFASQTPSGSVTITSVSGSAGATTLTTPQIPSHSHSGAVRGDQGSSPSDQPTFFVSSSTTTGSAGGGGSHTHPFSFSSGSGTFSGNAINLAVKYVDVIRATKD